MPTTVEVPAVEQLQNTNFLFPKKRSVLPPRQSLPERSEGTAAVVVEDSNCYDERRDAKCRRLMPRFLAVALCWWQVADCLLQSNKDSFPDAADSSAWPRDSRHRFASESRCPVAGDPRRLAKS